MKNNVPAFIREGGEVSGVGGKNHYLAYYETTKYWFIQSDKFFLENRGFISISSSGKYVLNSFLKTHIDLIFQTLTRWLLVPLGKKWTVEVDGPVKQRSRYSTTRNSTMNIKKLCKNDSKPRLYTETTQPVFLFSIKTIGWVVFLYNCKDLAMEKLP